jgi:hypothetical protein
MEARQMTKDMIAIATGMLVVGLGLWSFLDTPPHPSPEKTQAARILADDPALKHVSENSPYMRTER